MSAPASAPVRILVAEDDADILEMLDISLTSHGMQVLRAHHGGEALALLRGGSPTPELILLDLKMRVMDGQQFLAAQQADPTLAAIPVVVMTALEPTAQLASGLRVAAWLSKPLRLAELFRTITQVLGAERQEQA
jgi:CheY-like chemotaxis protein